MPDRENWSGLLFVGGISRSGTTILCTALDSSPEVSMGAELMGQPGTDMPEIVASIPDLAERDTASLLQYAVKLRGEPVRRRAMVLWARAGLTGSDLITASDLIQHTPLDDPMYQAKFAAYATRERSRREGTSWFGFKWNNGNVAGAKETFPESKFIAIIRHPSDVLRSGQQAGKSFDKDPEQVIKAWATTAERYEQFAARFPHDFARIRYEDLVTWPEWSLRSQLDHLQVPFHDAMAHHEDYDSVILSGRHINEAALRRPIQVPKSVLPKSTLEVPAELPEAWRQTLGEQLDSLGYTLGSVRPLPPPDAPDLTPGEFDQADGQPSAEVQRVSTTAVEEALAELSAGHRAVTYQEFVRLDAEPGSGYLLLRHDVGDDLDGALELARWQHARGLRATYVLDPDAWYFPVATHAQRSLPTRLVTTAVTLRELGHELALGAREAAPHVPVREIETLASLGMPIVGIASRGISIPPDDLSASGISYDADDLLIDRRITLNPSGGSVEEGVTGRRVRSDESVRALTTTS